MTKREFMRKYSVSERKMNSWLEKGWIRGVSFQEDGTLYIPEGALQPYSKRSAKVKGVGIYKSLVRGIAQGYDVFPLLYNMSAEWFATYIDKLFQAGFIDKTTIDGVTYNYATTKCLECNELTDSKVETFIRKALNLAEPVIEAAIKGAIAENVA